MYCFILFVINTVISTSAIFVFRICYCFYKLFLNVVFQNLIILFINTFNASQWDVNFWLTGKVPLPNLSFKVALDKKWRTTDQSLDCHTQDLYSYMINFLAASKIRCLLINIVLSGKGQQWLVFPSLRYFVLVTF